jgi:hypothetical protein
VEGLSDGLTESVIDGNKVGLSVVPNEGATVGISEELVVGATLVDISVELVDGAMEDAQLGDAVG